MILPRWTEKYSKAESGRDHLAYESVGVSMLERLLPGISNITMRARYYSFFPWVIYRFFKSEEPKTYGEFRTYLKTKSLAFLYANGLCHPEENTGINGIDLVRSDLDKGAKKEYFWSEKDIDKFKDNFWIYSQKLSQLKITADNEESEIESLTKTRGKELAEAFESSIENTEYFKEYCDKCDSKISTSALKQYGQTGGVMDLNKFPKEQKMLLETFFRFEDIPDEVDDFTRYYIAQTNDGSARARRESLLLYLDIINQHKGVFEYDNLRNIQYFSKVNKSLYKPNKKLEHNLEFWRIFQARQYFVYAIETIFHAVTLAIDEQPLSLDQIANNLLDKVDFASIKKDFGIDINKGTTIKEFFQKISNGKKDEVFDKFFNIDAKINEEKIFRLIRDNFRDKNYNYFVIYPLIILGFVYLRFNYYRKNKTHYWEFGKLGGQTNLSMDVFFEFIDRKIEEKTSIEEFLSVLIRDYICMQHTFVAIAKLSWYQNDTFHFSYDNGILHGLRIADANTNAPKFWNTLNILTDLGLITEKEGRYQLTAQGKNILNRI